MDKKMKNKGQVAIWIIVALIIVVMIALVYIFKPKITGTVQTQLNPQPIIENCIKDSVNVALSKLMPRGGFVNPNNSKTYNDINVNYLCENIGYSRTCINQHPLLIQEIEQEIKKDMTPAMDSCFDSLKKDLESKQNIVSLGPMSINIELEEGNVNVKIDRNMTVQKGTQSQTYEQFNTKVTSPVYELTRLAQEIANQESTNGYFEYVGYMVLYSRFDISVNTQSDSTKIYSIKDNYSNKIMNIAIRGSRIIPGV